MKTEKEIRAEMKRLTAKFSTNAKSEKLRPFEASEYFYKSQILAWVLGDNTQHISDIIMCPKCGNEAELIDAELDENNELIKTPYAHCLTCKYEW